MNYKRLHSFGFKIITQNTNEVETENFQNLRFGRLNQFKNKMFSRKMAITTHLLNDFVIKYLNDFLRIPPWPEQVLIKCVGIHFQINT